MDAISPVMTLMLVENILILSNCAQTYHKVIHVLHVSYSAFTIINI